MNPDKKWYKVSLKEGGGPARVTATINGGVVLFGKPENARRKMTQRLKMTPEQAASINAARLKVEEEVEEKVASVVATKKTKKSTKRSSTGAE